MIRLEPGPYLVGLAPALHTKSSSGDSGVGRGEELRHKVQQLHQLQSGEGGRDSKRDEVLESIEGPSGREAFRQMAFQEGGRCSLVCAFI